jgi:hypothetical protein
MRLALLFTLSLFLMTEGVVRLKLSKMSKEISRLGTYPANALAMSSKPGPQIAFVGNSLTGEGIDPVRVEQELRRAGVTTAQVGLYYLDGTGIGSWRTLSEELFWKRGDAPDVLVINFYSYMIENGHETSISIIPRHIASIRSWPDIFRYDIADPMDMFEFTTAFVSASFGDRQGLRFRILKLAVPGYKTTETKLLERNGAIANALRRPAGTRDFRSLNKLADRAREMHTRLLVVASPVLPGNEYKVDNEVVRLVEENGGKFIDLVSPDWKSADIFRDAVHLNSKGQQKYSEVLADIIAPLLHQ